MPHDLGDVVRLAIDITDGTNPAAAGAVTCTVTLPDDTTATPSISNPTLGRYTADYQTVQAGRHEVYWLATGTNASAHSDVFDVRPQRPGYIISLAEAKTQLKLTTSTDNDEPLRRVIEATTGVIERHLGLAVVKRAVTETLLCSAWAASLTHTPVLAVTSVTSRDGTVTWDPADLLVDNTTGVVRAVTGSDLYGWTTWTYTAGMRIIPAYISEAAEIIVQHLWETTRGNLGGPRFAGMDDSIPVTGMGYAIPNRALELLGASPPMVG